jgi:hypothetical protein
MPIELSRLMQLAAGSLPELYVGDLPRPIAEHLECHPAIVWLGTDELRKIVRKHGHAIRVELQCLYMAIRDGSYYSEPERPRCVTIYYRESETELSYVIGLKPACAGTEVWVQTFFRIDDVKRRRRQSKSTFLYAKKADRRP